MAIVNAVDYFFLAKKRWKLRSIRPKTLSSKGVVKHFAKFTGKHPCRRLFFNKIAGLRPVTLIKESLRHSCSALNFAKLLRKLFLWYTSDGSYLQWLLLAPLINSISDGFESCIAAPPEINFCTSVSFGYEVFRSTEWSLNPFHDTVLFLYPLKTSENRLVIGGIEGDQWHEIG